MDEELKIKIANKLQKMEHNLENEEHVRLRWLFIDKFIRCEVVCKLILSAYHQNQGKTIPFKDETLNMNVIPAAMKWARLDFTKEELGALFSGEGEYKKRGSKSAKLLRHGSMHEHKEKDILEIVDRFQELNTKMDAFLDRFRCTEKLLSGESSKKASKELTTV